MRIGAFSFESEVAFLSERLSAPVKIPKQKIVDDMLQSCGTCLLRKVKTGIWIAGTVKNGANLLLAFFFCSMVSCSHASCGQNSYLSLCFNMVDVFRSTACSMPRV